MIWGIVLLLPPLLSHRFDTTNTRARRGFSQCPLIKRGQDDVLATSVSTKDKTTCEISSTNLTDHSSANTSNASGAKQMSREPYLFLGCDRQHLGWSRHRVPHNTSVCGNCDLGGSQENKVQNTKSIYKYLQTRLRKRGRFVRIAGNQNATFPKMN